MRKALVLAALAAGGACSPAASPSSEADRMAFPDGIAGAHKIINTDGQTEIAFLATDGRYFRSGVVELESRWEAVDAGVCLYDEERGTRCGVPGVFDQKGAQVPITEAPEKLRVTRLDKAGVPGERDVVEPRVERVDADDGSVALNVWAMGGDMLSGPLLENGTWSAAGNEICFEPEGGASQCHVRDTPAEDGSWMATRPSGIRYRVMPLALSAP